MAGDVVADAGEVVVGEGVVGEGSEWRRLGMWLLALQIEHGVRRVKRANVSERTWCARMSEDNAPMK